MIRDELIIGQKYIVRDECWTKGEIKRTLGIATCSDYSAKNNIVQFVFESIPGQREISMRIITSNISMEWIKFDETQFFNREDKG